VRNKYTSGNPRRTWRQAAPPELRGEVESLLAQDSSETGALDLPAWVGVTGLSLDSTVALITPGTQLGPYKIEGPIAAGGMGHVFRGVDTRLGRPVAVKTSLQQFSARFDREARATSSLKYCTSPWNTQRTVPYSGRSQCGNPCPSSLATPEGCRLLNVRVARRFGSPS
jgi:serine/threonine protein kinase